MRHGKPGLACCKECFRRKYNDPYYAANKGRYRANAKRATQKIRDAIRAHLLANPCVDCGEPDIVVLEFDHVRGVKAFNVSQMAHKGQSVKTLSEEIAKCEVRCANCHRRATAERGNHWRTKS